jgi:hypothetical protein
VYKCPETKALYVWENGEPDKGCGPVITRKGCPKNSAHLIPLKSRLKAYDGIVYIRRLLCKKPLNQSKYVKFVANNLGNDYSWDIPPSVNQRGGVSLLPLSFLEEKKDGSSGWICSQLVALTYKELGIMNLLQPSQTYMPTDFAKDDIINTECYALTCPELLYSSIPITEK